MMRQIELQGRDRYGDKGEVVEIVGDTGKGFTV